MELLQETMAYEQSGMIIQETTDVNQKKNLWFAGVFGEADVINGNKRKYPLNEMTNAVNGAIKIINENGGIFGELDHPATLTLNSDRISHAITELRMDGNKMYGKAKILVDTPCGKIAEALINSGIRMGVSTRGGGNLNESGVVSNFTLITVDLVPNPSAPNAFPKGIYESLMEAKNGQKILTLAEQVREDQAAQKYLKREIMAWINSGLLTKR